MSPPAAEQETRLTLTTPDDPNDATTPEADEAPESQTPETEASRGPASDAQEQDTAEAPEPEPGQPTEEVPAEEEPAAGTEEESAADAEDEPSEPGVSEAIGGVRAAFMRMLDAHITLLRAELEIAGKEIGLIAGLAIGALVIALLVLGLLYVGGFLFVGEWLFGSMGWGIIHGTLLGVAIIGFAGVNLGGGDVRAYAAGAAVGLGVVVVLAALLLSNVGNQGGEAVSRWFQDEIVTGSDLPFGSEWVATLAGLAIGAVIGGAIALIASWRTQFGHPFGLLMTGLVVGGFIGALYVSTRYDAADGVMGMAIMIGLLTWIVAGIAFAAQRGFDPEARYAGLIPRESIAAFEKSKEFLTDQWEHQKNRMMGR